MIHYILFMLYFHVFEKMVIKCKIRSDCVLKQYGMQYVLLYLYYLFIKKSLM